MTKSIRILFFTLFFTTFYLTSYAQQQSLKIKNMAAKADVVLTGRVIQKESSWNKKKTKIYTKTTIQIDEYLKGESPVSSVEIISAGGEVGGIGEFYSHMPKFEEKEEVLVFLKKDKKNSMYKVLHGQEGKLTIIEDLKTNEKITPSKIRIKTLKAIIKNAIQTNPQR